ncbi:MAG TPA: DNA-3-methyladenine glycosylase I [Vicinamibacteria bacterium]|nr:DNA-3-methyladenine glycosylase I [Vicinamibacteria bacterium]
MGLGRRRCPWAGSDPLYVAYHDEEWGVPLRDDRALFELLTLEGAQAGLAWITILRKREAYRAAFDGFDPERIARYDRRKVAALLRDPGIVRNRAKVLGTVRNARAFLQLVDETGSFHRYLWSFVGGRPKPNRFRSLRQVPPESDESRAMSKALRKRGFTFVGPTICYAFMQAAGMVNDHLIGCFRHREVGRAVPGQRRRRSASNASGLGGRPRRSRITSPDGLSRPNR